MTRGHYGTASAGNARWTITDRCDGTLARDGGGSVLIQDVPHSKLIVLRRGQSYLAKPQATSAGKHHRAPKAS